MELRTLRAGEEEALLALLDAWAVGDGWRGRDFFGRYLEHDPTYRPGNVHVAEDAGRLVACVQIFPRRLRLRGHAVPTGGIGSVFTAEDRRGEGLGGRLLARAVEAMTQRGMEVALLFAGPVAWYEARGWRSWPRSRLLLELADAAPSGEPEPFEAGRDLDAAIVLHERFDAARDGCVIRDAALWRASLRVAGNPDEDFLVARRAGALVAYARGILLEGLPLASEWACQPGEERTLAGLLIELLGRHPGKPTMAGTRAADPRLWAALEQRGVRLREVEDPTAVLRCLDAPALARRLGEALAPAESGEAFLARLLPPERLGVWPADRF